jgi:transposase
LSRDRNNRVVSHNNRRRVSTAMLLITCVLRFGVLWRHTSFGTHSSEGSRFVERMLTVRDTLRQQQRDVLDYLTTACQAALQHHPAPSLLPQRTIRSS